MRRCFWVLPFVLTACASKQQTGQALVVAGTTAVIVGATTGATHCNQHGCVEVSSRAKKTSAAVAGAGVAAVAAGTLLQEEAQRDAASRPAPSQADPELVPATYRLPRRDPSGAVLAEPE
jgi:hypothetical protein